MTERAAREMARVVQALAAVAAFLAAYGTEEDRMEVAELQRLCRVLTARVQALGREVTR